MTEMDVKEAVDDPVAFVRDVLRVDPDEWQKAALRALFADRQSPKTMHAYRIRDYRKSEFYRKALEIMATNDA